MDLISHAKNVLKGAPSYQSMVQSGQLQKARLVAYREPEGAELPELSVDFFLNPNSIQVIKSVKLEQPQTEGQTQETRWTATNPIELKLGELWFDTYESRTSVRKEYIDKLEKLLQYVKDTHHIPCVRFVWGQFTQSSNEDANYLFYVQRLAVDYSMFLPDGTPVRAKAQLDLKQCLSVDKQQDQNQHESPDHAKLYTVKRGDTLQAIANQEYEDPREWRRIADTNKIDDPMNLDPGTKLLVPPILK